MIPSSSDLDNEFGTNVLVMLIGVPYYSDILNLILGVFNLITAFPMDGGRILRSLLYNRNKNYDRSTRIAVKIGIIISYIFFGLGLLTFLLDHLSVGSGYS